MRLLHLAFTPLAGVDSRPPTLSYGIMGNVSRVPAGHTMETLLLHRPSGVTDAVLAWGDALLAYGGSGKRREDAWHRDMTLRTLGYSTDNGAYYCTHAHAHANRHTRGTC